MAWGNVFKGLPKDLTREQVLFFDAVDLIVPACQLQYARLREAASVHTEVEILREAEDANFTPDELSELTRQLTATIVSYAGSFVATIQRLRRVLKRIRGDGDIRLAKRAFEAAIRPYEDARHHLEHLDTAIPMIVPSGHGTLGQLAWHFVRPDGSHQRMRMMFPGHLEGGATVAIRVEASIRPPVDHLWWTIGGEDYYLTGAADAVDRLSERLEAWSEQWIALAPE